MSASNVSRTCSPTSSISASRSSCDESAWPTLLTVASSATRWRVSWTQASVVERDAEAAGQGGQEPLVVLAERVRAVDVLERDDPGRAAADDERDEERRLGRLPAEHEGVAVALRAPPA